jgi:hypothetical protein
MNQQAKTSIDGFRPYDNCLGVLESIWGNALKISDNLREYHFIENAMMHWSESIYKGLIEHFYHINAQRPIIWQQAITELVPVIQVSEEKVNEVDVLRLINAAWWCRALFPTPNNIAIISEKCTQILQGRTISEARLTEPPLGTDQDAFRIVASKVYDLENDIDKLKHLILDETIKPIVKVDLSSNLMTSISEQLSNLEVFMNKYEDMPLSVSLERVVNLLERGSLHTLKRETHDFLSGALMKKDLPDQGIIELAEVILLDFSLNTRVRLSPEVILGKSNYLSLLSGVFYKPLADLDIWNLPLLAHDLGHMISLENDKFSKFHEYQIRIIKGEYRNQYQMEDKQNNAYIYKRSQHIFEFFADAFGVYYLGPAFVLNAILLHFNPLEAYLDRDLHPTYAERVDLMLEILRMMGNQEEGPKKFEFEPYHHIARLIAEIWTDEVERVQLKPDHAYEKHEPQVKYLAEEIYGFLERYYRLLEFRGKDWLRAVSMAHDLIPRGPDPEIYSESLRNLLNIAWAFRIHQPAYTRAIERFIREVCSANISNWKQISNSANI